jgi:hypothetical protein
MCPCSPNDVSLDIPIGPSGPSIPGFGSPFAGLLPNLNPFPEKFPEDLLSLLDTLQLLTPPGAFKPQLSPNFSKDVFDTILSLLDQFMPFLMLYKFFLPVLNIIVCIIEVLCSLTNPFKLPKAISRLFRTCIPDFLNLFPIFALLITIISLLLLLLALIEYIIEQIVKFIEAILRNLAMLTEAFEEASEIGILAIAQKLGSLLCIFQNLFVLLAIFSIIIQVIKDIFKLSFSVPCADSEKDDEDGCCTTDVCPAIIKNGNYTRNTGKLKYLNEVSALNAISGLPSGFNEFKVNLRKESWQLYDLNQNLDQEFINIVNGYDVPVDQINNPPPYYKNIFFPTDLVINSQTTPKQAPYTIDLRLFYNPLQWGRKGIARYIQFKNCIVTAAPTNKLLTFDNTPNNIKQGVVLLSGGLGYEDDGSVLYGFNADGVTVSDAQATLSNFIYVKPRTSTNPVFFPTDAYTFEDVEYTFKPNRQSLLKSDLITVGCMPDVAISKGFIHAIYTGDIAYKTSLFGDLLNGRNGKVFPDPAEAQLCLATALDALRSNMTNQGVAEFRSTITVCLQKLKDDTNSALGDLVGIAFDPCQSKFTITPTMQFTTKPIVISVELNEKNGLLLTNGLSDKVAENIAARLRAHITFGEVDEFIYDGYKTFTANLHSTLPGNGSLMISFDNQTLCTNITDPPSHTLQEKTYQFIYAPVVPMISAPSDTTQTRRTASDQG